MGDFQLSPDQQDCPPGALRVISTVLFIGHGKLEPAQVAEWTALVRVLCEPFGAVGTVKYNGTAGAHFVSFGTRAEAEAAMPTLHRRELNGRHLKVGWARGLGVDKERFDTERGVGFVQERAVEGATVWEGRVRSAAELLGESRRPPPPSAGMAEGRAPPPPVWASPPGFAATPSPPTTPFSPPAVSYSPVVGKADVGGGSRPPLFHHPSRAPPVVAPAPPAAAAGYGVYGGYGAEGAGGPTNGTHGYGNGGGGGEERAAKRSKWGDPASASPSPPIANGYRGM